MGKNTIAILGGRGMLGTDMANACANRGLHFQVFDLPEFDITNTDRLARVVPKADIIINCAAYTNVNKAESEFDLAYKLNATAVGELGTLAKKAKKFVCHISTDFVFDGKSDTPYVETDPTSPINAYGRTKLAGEQLLEQSGCDYFIIRTQWTYGHAGDNFIKKLITRAQNNKEVNVVDDQTGAPTATAELAKMICRLLPLRPSGCFHFAASGYVTRFEMAEFIFNNLNMPVNLIRCKSSDFPSPATRPLNSRFNCEKIQALLDEPIVSWKIPLKHFLEQL
ncbi:MAG: dTDP-4-dehydrorhamnose reductase [Planctomycetota bacterium]|jgi:dTDP-4-dehydrorhamnose reductase